MNTCTDEGSEPLKGSEPYNFLSFQFFGIIPITQMSKNHHDEFIYLCQNKNFTKDR